MISVVMPSMNQAGFIEEAIRSVFSQGVDALELVVMDGGSSDGTQHLLASLAAEFDGRLRWFSGPDGGPASAVNGGVQSARGALIGWLNSDDRYAPGAIRRALDAFAADPELRMVYGEGDHIGERGDRIDRYPTLPPDAPLSAWADGCPICQPTAFFRRDAFLALGGLDTHFRASFDYEFWLRLSDADFFADIDADGWARDTCELRLRQPAAEPVAAIVVHGEHALPVGGALELDVLSPDGLCQAIEVARAGRFSFEIPVTEQRAGARLVYRVVARRPCSPVDWDDSSSDRRLLSFRLQGCELRAA